MHYRLRDNLSFCIAGGHAIFLDIDADQYFRLPNRLEDDFLSYVNTGNTAGESLRALSDRNILTSAPMTGTIESPPPIAALTRSAVELQGQHRKSVASLIPEVFALVWSSARQLRTRPLKDILDTTAQYRRTHRAMPVFNPSPAHEQRLLEYSQLFMRARLHIPIGTRCLLDSLALTRFLARRGQYANIVFGVTSEPFSAHCWVQVGNIVLNDTLGSATFHTPIKVI